MINNHLIKDKKSLKAMITLFKAHGALINFIKQDIKDTSFDINEFGVFEIIYHKERLTINEIKDKVLIANSSLTYVLDKLVSKGLVIKEKCNDDKRVTYVRLSEKGLIEAREIFPKHYDNLKKIFEIISPEDEAVLVKTLKKIGLYAKEETKWSIHL